MTFLANATHEFRHHKALADRAMSQLSDAQFFQRPAPQVNPVALVVKHLAGNLASRWSDLLIADGDKPTRDRDAEFVVTEQDTRVNLLSAWDRAWQVLFDTLSSLTDADLEKPLTIRGERHTVQQALLRGLSHAAYHIGQILYIARCVNPNGTWQTIPPGESRNHTAAYLQPK